jgi:hypothetical protein
VGGEVVDQLSEWSLGLAALGQGWGSGGGTAAGGSGHAPDHVVQGVEGELFIVELEK